MITIDRFRVISEAQQDGSLRRPMVPRNLDGSIAASIVTSKILIG